MPETPSHDRVERSVLVEASPETVFELFTNGEQMVSWMGRQATLDPRPGGTFRVDTNGTYIASGRYVSVDPPRLVAFTWGWEEEGAATPPGSSIVTVSFEHAEGGTLVQLTHTGLVGDEVASHGEGWDYFFPRLEAAARQAGAGR